MTDNKIEPVDLRNTAEQLRAKIQLGFVELISEEQWNNMLLTELKAFTELRQERDYSGRPQGEPTSGLRAVCTSILKEMVTEELKKAMAAEEAGRPIQQLRPLIKEWLTENADAVCKAMVASFMGTGASMLVQAFQNAINERRVY